MNVLPANLRAFADAAADRIAKAIAGLHRDAQRESDLRQAEHRARLAELDARIAAVTLLERQVSDRLAGLKDGEPGLPGKSVTVDDVVPLVESTVRAALAEIPQPKDGLPGKDADPDAIAAMVDDAVRAAVATLPPPPAGRDADPVLVARMIERAVSSLPPAQPGKDADPAVIAAMVADQVREAVAALPPPQRGEPGPPGLLPVVREWSDAVHYEGAVVTHLGSTWQARRDTGREPPHDDWACLAAGGTDGAPGVSFAVRGTWASAETYRRLDVVARDGSSFVARCDNPGACPGDGWQLVASRGKSGPPGERGIKGDRGPAGPGVRTLSIDGNGLLALENADGSVIACDLYPLLSRIGG